MSTLGFAAVIIVAVLTGFFIHSVIYHAREGVKVGQPAPAFMGELSDGTRITQADWNRTPKPLMLCFISPRCNVCKRLALLLDQLRQAHTRVELDILLMGLSGTQEDFTKWKQDLDIDLPVAVDIEGTTKYRYAVYALPAIFFISPGGIVEESMTGFREADKQKYRALFQKYSEVPQKEGSAGHE